MKIIFDKTFLSELKQGGNTLIINSYQFVNKTWESDGSVDDIFNEGRLNTFIDATGNVEGKYTKRYEDNFYPLWEENTKHLKFGVTLPTEIFYTESKESESGIKEEPIHFVYIYYTTPRARYDESINDFVEEKINRPAFVVAEQDEEGNFIELNDKLSVGNTTIFTIKFPEKLVKANIQANGNTDVEFLEGRGISYGVNVFSIDPEDYYNDKLLGWEVSRKSYEVWNRNIKSDGGENHPDTLNCLDIFGEKISKKSRVYKKYENLTLDFLPNTIIGSYPTPVVQGLNRDFTTGCGEEFNLVQFTGKVDLIEYQINDEGSTVELTRRTMNIQEVPEVRLITVKAGDNPLIDHKLDQKNKIFLYRKVSEDNSNAIPMCGVYLEISYVDHKGIVRLITSRSGTSDYNLLLVQGNLTDQKAYIVSENLIGYQYPRKYKYGNVDAFAFPNYKNSSALFKIRTENFVGKADINLYVINRGGELDINEDNITAGKYFSFERLENDNNDSNSEGYVKEYKVSISTKDIIEGSQWQPISRELLTQKKPVMLRIVVRDPATGYRMHYDLYCAQKGDLTVGLSASLYTADKWTEELKQETIKVDDSDEVIPIPGVYKLDIDYDVIDHYTLDISSEFNRSPDWFVEGIDPEQAVINPLDEITGAPGMNQVTTGKLDVPAYLYINAKSESVNSIELNPITFYNFTPTTINQSPSDSFLEYLETPSSTVLMKKDGQEGKAVFVNLANDGKIHLRNDDQEINLYRFNIKTNGPVKLKLNPKHSNLFGDRIIIFDDIDFSLTDNFQEGTEITIENVYDFNRVLNIGLKLKDNLFSYESEILEVDGIKLKKYEYGTLTLTALENNRDGKSQSADIVVYTRDADPEPVMKTYWDSNVKLVSYKYEEESVDSFIEKSCDYLILPKKNKINIQPYFLSSDTPFVGLELKSYIPKVDCKITVDDTPRKLEEVDRGTNILIIPKDDVYYLGLHYSFGEGSEDYTGMYVKVGYTDKTSGEIVNVYTLRFRYKEDEGGLFGSGDFSIVSDPTNPGFFKGVPIQDKVYENPNTKSLYKLDKNGEFSELDSESFTADLSIESYPVKYDHFGYIKHDLNFMESSSDETYPIKEIAKITLNSINAFSDISDSGLILFDGVATPSGSLVLVNYLSYSGKLEDRHKSGIYLYFDDTYKKAFYITDGKKYSYNLSGTYTAPIVDYESFAEMKNSTEFIPIQDRYYWSLSGSNVYKAEAKTSENKNYIDLSQSDDYKGTNSKTYGVIREALPPKISFTTNPNEDDSSVMHHYLPCEINFTSEIIFYSPYKVTARLGDEDSDKNVVSILSLTRNDSVWEDGVGYEYKLILMSMQQGDEVEEINLASIILTSELNSMVSITDTDGNTTGYSEILDESSLDVDSDISSDVWRELVDKITGETGKLTATREIKLGKYGSLSRMSVSSKEGTVIKESGQKDENGNVIDLNTIDIRPTESLDDIFTYTAPVDKAWIDTDSIKINYVIPEGGELNEEEKSLFGVSSLNELYPMPNLLNGVDWGKKSCGIQIPKKLLTNSLYKKGGLSLDDYYNKTNKDVSYFNKRILEWLRQKEWGSQDVSMNYEWTKYDPKTETSESFEKVWTVRNIFYTYPIYRGILYNSETNTNKFFIYDDSEYNVLKETIAYDETEIKVQILLMDTHPTKPDPSGEEIPNYIYEINNNNVGMGLSGIRPQEISEHDAGLVVEGLDTGDLSYSPGFSTGQCNLNIKLDSINEDIVKRERSFFVNYEETTYSGSDTYKLEALKVLHRLKVTVIQEALDPIVKLSGGNGIYNNNNIYVHSSGSVLDLSDENNISSINSISFYTNIPQNYLVIQCDGVNCPWDISYGAKEDDGLYKVTVSGIVFPENISKQAITRTISIYYYNPNLSISKGEETIINVYQGYYSLGFRDLKNKSYDLSVGDYDNPLIGAPRSYNQAGYDRNVFSLVLTQAEYYQFGSLNENELSYYGSFGISDDTIVWQRAYKNKDGDIILSDISELLEEYETSFVTTTSTPDLTDKVPFIENEYISKELSYGLDFLMYIKVPIMLKYPEDDLICPGAEVIDQYAEFWIRKQAE